MQTWESTLLVVSHDRHFLDSVPTDIIYLHSQRLESYRYGILSFYRLPQICHFLNIIFVTGAIMKILLKRRMKNKKINSENGKLSNN